MRTLLLELRPAALEETSLPDLLKQLAEATTGRSGVKVAIDIDSSCSLPIPVRVALYRIAQESLNNVVKHARARHVSVILQHGHDRIALSVRDDGQGFKPSAVPQGHLGIGIMLERAQAVGARLVIESQLGAGTLIMVTWPDIRE